MDELERIKNMTIEEANAYLEELNACAHDCANCEAECNTRVKKPAKKVIAVMSGKGGTGKSVVSVLLAKALLRQGVKAAILDADIVCSEVPHLLGMHDPVLGEASELVPAVSAGGIPVVSMALISENAREPIIWSGLDLAKAAVYLMTETKWDADLDVLLVDMPSGAGDIPLEYYTTMPFDCSLFVITPGAYGAISGRRAVNLAEMLLVPVMGLVENFAAEGFALDACFDDIPTAASLPYDAALRAAADAGRLESYETDALDFLAKMIND